MAQPELRTLRGHGVSHAAALIEVQMQRSTTKAVQPNIGRVGMKNPAPCHSEAPVLWGPKNPCSFFERPVRQPTDEWSLRTAEILRRPKERDSSG
jgi:hypothetical protein